jgi:hypothetical protein
MAATKALTVWVARDSEETANYVVAFEKPERDVSGRGWGYFRYEDGAWMTPRQYAATGLPKLKPGEGPVKVRLVRDD